MSYSSRLHKQQLWFKLRSTSLFDQNILLVGFTGRKDNKDMFVKSGSCQGGVCQERWPRPIGGGGSSLDPLLSFKPFHIVARPTASLLNQEEPYLQLCLQVSPSPKIRMNDNVVDFVGLAVQRLLFPILRVIFTKVHLGPQAELVLQKNQSEISPWSCWAWLCGRSGRRWRCTSGWGEPPRTGKMRFVCAPDVGGKHEGKVKVARDWQIMVGERMKTRRLLWQSGFQRSTNSRAEHNIFANITFLRKSIQEKNCIGNMILMHLNIGSNRNGIFHTVWNMVVYIIIWPAMVILRTWLSPHQWFFC